MLKRRLVGDRYFLPAGERLTGTQTYHVLGQLSGGAFSVGYRGRAENGEECFIKEFLPAQHPSERAEVARIFAQECDVLRRIGNYELCPRFWDAFQQCGFHYLVQDFIPGRDMESVLAARTQLDQDTLVRWSISLCRAMAFLHSRQVVHHDLKPANIRINPDGDPILVDFGAARWYRRADEKVDILYGTEGYLAPEYASQNYEDLPAGMRMDVFALGRILVEMMVGQRLTQAEIDQRHDQLYGSILHNKSLDLGFVRAVFRSVSYSPEHRYASAIEMEQDLVASIPPVARRRPGRIDLGLAPDTRPREAVLSVFNVGGGTLAGEVSTDVEWLEIGAAGPGTARQQPFDRNRQSIRVVAFPDRLPSGAAAEGRVIVSTGSGYLETVVALRRGLDLSLVTAQPERLRLGARAGQPGQAKITFKNRATVPVSVRVQPPAQPPVAVEPSVVEVPPAGQAEVVLTVDGGSLSEGMPDGEVGWSVNGVERPAIPVEFKASGGGLLGRVAGNLPWSRASSSKQS